MRDLDYELAAERFARHKHGDTLDDSGKNYFESHVMQVVSILKQVTQDSDIIVAGYLHDVVEDCGVTHAELEACFSKRVADLVLEVTHEGQKDNVGYYFPRLKTKDGILIKLADRTSNISRMEAWDISRQEHYLKKTKFWKSSPKG